MNDLGYVITIEVILWIVAWMVLSGAVITVKRVIEFRRLWK